MREHCARSVGVDSSRSGASPHRQQASSWSWSIVPLPRFCRRCLSGVYRHRPTRACAAGPVGVLSQRAARPCLRPSMSHVIPLRLVQMLNPHRWNCNVFGWSRKVTEGKLRAKFVWRLSGRRPRVQWLGSCLEARPRSPALRPLRLGVCWADDGGFCSIRSILPACRRRVAPLLLQFPPFGGALDVGQAQPFTSHSAIPPVAGCEVAVRGGEVEVRGGEVEVQGGEVAVQGSMAPKVQTTSVKNANNGVLRARWSAIWAQRRLATRSPAHQACGGIDAPR